MNQMPEISVIVPIYNAANYLQVCLESLQAQSMRTIEFILVLDKPTDGSDLIAKEFAQKDNRFIIVENSENKHIGESRNIGLQIARGTYIGFSDHDDIAHPLMYQTLYEKAIKTNADIVFSLPRTTLSNDENNSQLFPSLPANAYRHYCLDDILRGGDTTNYSLFNTIHANIYQKRLLDEHQIRFVDTRTTTPEDKLFQIEALFAAKQIELINSELYLHINHAHNSGDDFAYQQASLRANGLNYIYLFLNKNQTLPIYQEAFYQGAAKQCLLSLAATMRYAPDQFFKARKILKALPFCQEAMRYAPPSNKGFIARLFRRFLVKMLKEH